MSYYSKGAREKEKYTVYLLCLGHTFKSAGAVMGVSAACIKKYKGRAINKMRRKWAQEGLPFLPTS